MTDQSQGQDNRLVHRYLNPDGTPMSEEEKRRIDDAWKKSSPSWAQPDRDKWDGNPNSAKRSF